MKFPMMILLSAALIAPSNVAFAASGDPAEQKRCVDSLGRRIACTPAQEGRSVGEVGDDQSPLLIGGGLLLAGGIAAAIAASDSGGGGGALFLSTSSPTTNNYVTNNYTRNFISISP